MTHEIGKCKGQRQTDQKAFPTGQRTGVTGYVSLPSVNNL